MSEKRPETSADIVSRSRVLDGATDRAPSPSSGRRARGYSVDLQHHMAECDANYARLHQIFPNLRDNDRLTLSLALPGLTTEVEFLVKERGPYTTLLHIAAASQEHWLDRAVAPDFTVRIYHDARSAEVVAFQHQNRFHGKYEYPNRGMRQRDEKAQINRYLSEFLTVCLSHGISTDPIF